MRTPNEPDQPMTGGQDYIVGDEYGSWARNLRTESSTEKIVEQMKPLDVRIAQVLGLIFMALGFTISRGTDFEAFAAIGTILTGVGCVLNSRFLAKTATTALSAALVVTAFWRFLAFLSGNGTGAGDLWLVMIGIYFVQVIAPAIAQDASTTEGLDPS